MIPIEITNFLNQEISRNLDGLLINAVNRYISNIRDEELVPLINREFNTKFHSFIDKKGNEIFQGENGGMVSKEDFYNNISAYINTFKNNLIAELISKYHMVLWKV